MQAPPALLYGELHSLYSHCKTVTKILPCFSHPLRTLCWKQNDPIALSLSGEAGLLLNSAPPDSSTRILHPPPLLAVLPKQSHVLPWPWSFLQVRLLPPSTQVCHLISGKTRNRKSIYLSVYLFILKVERDSLLRKGKSFQEWNWASEQGKAGTPKARNSLKVNLRAVPLGRSIVFCFRGH